MITIDLIKFSTSSSEENLTPNLSLKKPNVLDKYTVLTQNENSDKIDNAINNFTQYRIQTKTLWTNPSPKSTFNPQKVSVPNLKDYQEIEVFFYNWVGQTTHLGIQSVKVPVANGNAFHFSSSIMLWERAGKPGLPHFGGRLGTMNTVNNTVSFDYNYGVLLSVLPGTRNADQQWNVPIKIVGYKYV